MSLLAATITKACFAWILAYIFVGSSTAGKSFFKNLVWIEDTKGGLPLLTLTYPILIAATVCSLLVVQKPSRSCLCPPKTNRRKTGRLRRVLQNWLADHGDGNFDLYAVVFVLLPFACYTIFAIHRHLTGMEVNLVEVLLGIQSLDEHTSRKVVSEIGNSFGMAAIVAMGIFLIPTSKDGPLMKVFGWSHALAIRLHLWAGRVVVVGSLAHGLFHVVRWKYQLGEDMVSFIVPPRQCWAKNADENFAPTCNNPNTKCTCYEHFLFFTGFVAVVMATIILVTSSNWVRRKSYHLFLTCHILVAPIFLLAVIFHYHRAILYMAPSLLYYLATTSPRYLEKRRNVGVTVTSVEVIGTGAEKCISLTFEATRDTVQAFRPGMYTNLCVPSISNVAHPFSLNKVGDRDDQLRIIFKAIGPFTQQLAVLLEAESGIPTIHLDGLHGIPTRMHQLRQHDTDILVAGGIGVTPFLSLITDAVKTNTDDGKILPHYASRMKTLIMHWSCRDASLLEYIRREYLNPLQERITPYSNIEIHLYHTGSTPCTPCNENNAPVPTEEDISIRKLEHPTETVQVTEPFRLARMSPSRTVSSNILYCVSLSAILWPGLAILWFSYKTQSKHEIIGRGVAPVFLLIYSIIMSYFVARILPYHWFGKSSDLLELKLNDDSEHSYEESMPLSRPSSTGSLSMSDEESAQIVTINSRQGRPDLEFIFEPVIDARWPAIYSCGPAGMVDSLKRTAHEISHNRNLVEPSRSAPLVTIYDEAFLM